MLNPPSERRNVRSRATKERNDIQKEVVRILRGRVPTRFPTLTSSLHDLCVSGRALFSQYQMLESSCRQAELAAPIITIERDMALVPEWVNDHLNLMTQDWNK